MAANALTLMDVMPSAMDRINIDQAAQQRAQQNQYQAAVLQQAQQQAQAQNALTMGQQASPTNAMTPQGTQQPQGQNALNQPRQQVQVPENYGQVVAQQEDQARQLAAQQQIQQQRQNDMTETMNYRKLDEPLIAQFTADNNTDALNALATKRAADNPNNSTLQDYAAALHGNKIAKGIMDVTPYRVTSQNVAEGLYNQATPEDKARLANMGVLSATDLVGKDVGYEVNIKDQHRIPGTIKIEPKSKDEQALDLADRKAAQADEKQAKLFAQQQKLETQREDAADRKFERQQRQAEIRQEHSDSRFAQGLQLREYNASAMPAKTALGTAYRTSNAAAGFENKIKANVATLNNWMDQYVKKHPGAANRTGAVLNDLINGKITGEGDLSNIKAAADSVGFELGKLESGSYGTAGASKNATEHFNQLKISKGIDNMRTQLKGITSLAETARRAQDTVTEQAEDTFNDVRSQYGLPAVGKARKAARPAPATPSNYKIGAPYKAPGQNTKQIIGVHREGGKVTKIMLADKSVVEVP